MVDDARKLNVEDSMAYKPWSTEQFSGVLAKHSSEVCIMVYKPWSTEQFSGVLAKTPVRYVLWSINHGPLNNSVMFWLNTPVRYV
jgi:hypothetical protein